MMYLQILLLLSLVAISLAAPITNSARKYNPHIGPPPVIIYPNPAPKDPAEPKEHESQSAIDYGNVSEEYIATHHSRRTTLDGDEGDVEERSFGDHFNPPKWSPDSNGHRILARGNCNSE
jgi:hypothetical protein